MSEPAAPAPVYAVIYSPDGEGPDEMNVRLVGPLPVDVADNLPVEAIAVVPQSWDDWVAERTQDSAELGESEGILG
jgi:hypothetical protein